MLRSLVGVAGSSAVAIGVKSNGRSSAATAADGVASGLKLTALPAAIDPGLQAWTLSADGCVIAVPRHHDGVTSKWRKHQFVDGLDDGVEVAAELGVARPPGKERVAAEQHRRIHEFEAHGAIRVPRCLDRTESQLANLEDLFVLDELVIARQHVGVFLGDMHAVTCVAHLGDGTNVVMVAVRFQYFAYAELLAQFQQEPMFVGSIDQDGITRVAATHHEHVVLVVAYDHSMDLGLVILVVERWPSPGSRVNANRGASTVVLYRAAQIRRSAHIRFVVMRSGHFSIVVVRAVVGSSRSR